MSSKIWLNILASYWGVIMIIIFPVGIANAQLVTNDGAAIFSDNGALIFVDGEMVNQNGGTYDNSGTIELTGDWTNNAGNNAFTNSSPGEVLMSGGNQLIQGTDPTHFHDLTLTGTGIKTQAVDAHVEDTLHLNDRELGTDIFTMFILSTNVTAINRTTGFVSSLGSGGLSRNTDDITGYQYPLGSSAGVLRYRPIELFPTTAIPHTYKARMANVDATTEGYDRAVNDSTFCVINPDFYHLIYQTNGADPVDMSLFFDDILDNSFTDIAHWQNQPRWENAGVVVTNPQPSPTLSSLTLTGWNNFTEPAFGLATSSPAVSLSATDTSICQGDTIQFTASSGFTNYEFFVNSISMQSTGSNTYTALTPLDGDTLRVTATDAACTAFSNEITITVNALPAIDISSALVSDENCGNGDGSISGISVSGGAAPLTFDWTDGTLATVGTDTNLANVPGDTYTLTVTEANGCVATAGPFTINGGPGVALDSTGVVITQSSCGASDGSIIGVGPVGGTAPLTYDWSDGIASVGTDTTLLNVPAGNYTITVFDANGCSDTLGLFTVTDAGAPAVDSLAMVVDTSQCGIGTGGISGLLVSAGSTPYSYLWDDPSAQSTLDATGLAAGTYTLTITDALGCIEIFGSITVPEFTTPNAPTSVAPGPYCEGDAVADLTAGGSGGTITWYNNAGLTNVVGAGSPFASGTISDTTFWVTETNNGCESPATQVDIVFTTTPSAPVTSADPTYCEGETINDLQAAGTDITWWADAGLTVFLASGATLTINPTVGITQYYVTQSMNGCDGPASVVTVTVNAAPEAGPGMVICQNTEASGFLDTTNATPAGGTWSTSNTEISAFLSPNGYLDHDNMGWGTYHFIYSVNGCSDVMYVDIIGSDAGADTAICPEENTFFLPASYPGGGTWTSPDPVASINILDPIMGEVEKFGLAGDFVFVYDNQGCPDSVLVTVCEDVENTVFVPNIFSPNGDLENDVLTVFGENLDDVKIKIYDRWGELLYESTSAEEAVYMGWDGTYEGKKLTPQVFVYYLEGNYLDGETFFFQGNITLVK